MSGSSFPATAPQHGPRESPDGLPGPWQASWWHALGVAATTGRLDGPAATRLERLALRAAQPDAREAFPARYALTQQYAESVPMGDPATLEGRLVRNWRLVPSYLRDLAPARLYRDLARWTAWWGEPMTEGERSASGGGVLTREEVLTFIREAAPVDLLAWLDRVAPLHDFAATGSGEAVSQTQRALRTLTRDIPPRPATGSGLLCSTWWYQDLSNGTGLRPRFQRPSPSAAAAEPRWPMAKLAPMWVIAFAPVWSVDLLEACAQRVGLEGFSWMVEQRLTRAAVHRGDIQPRPLPGRWWTAIIQPGDLLTRQGWLGAEGFWCDLTSRDTWRSWASAWLAAQLEDRGHPTRPAGLPEQPEALLQWLLTPSATACWEGRRATGLDLWEAALSVLRHKAAAVRASRGEEGLADAAGRPSDSAQTPQVGLLWADAVTRELLRERGTRLLGASSWPASLLLRILADPTMGAILATDGELLGRCMRHLSLDGMSLPDVWLQLGRLVPPAAWSPLIRRHLRSFCLSTLVSDAEALPRHGLVVGNPMMDRTLSGWIDAWFPLIAQLPVGDELRSLLTRVMLQQILTLDAQHIPPTRLVEGRRALLEGLWGAWCAAGTPTPTLLGAGTGAVPVTVLPQRCPSGLTPLEVFASRALPAGKGRARADRLVERTWGPWLARLLESVPAAWLGAHPRSWWRQGLLSPDVERRRRWIARLGELAPTLGDAAASVVVEDEGHAMVAAMGASGGSVLTPPAAAQIAEADR